MAILKWLIGAGVAWGLFAGKKALDEITWQLQKVKLSDIRPFKGEFDIWLVVKNNTDIDIGLTGFNGTVSRGGQVIGKFNSVTNANLPAQQPAKIKAVVKLQAESALDQIQDILDNGGLLNPMQVKSLLMTSLVNIPVNRTIEFVKVS